MFAAGTKEMDMFVLSYTSAPEGGAAFGKTTEMRDLGHAAQVAVAIREVLIFRKVDRTEAVAFALNTVRSFYGEDRMHEGTGLTFRYHQATEAPHPCPCCGRLVKLDEHANATHEDAYCTGCYTWSRSTEPCLPANTAHPQTPITVHVSSTDGLTYLRTQHGETAEQIAEALAPYVGRTMRMDLPNNYGHFHTYHGVLKSIDGANVTVYVPAHDYTATIDAMQAFGTNCTTIQKADD
jgi:hypothetical protein